MNNDFFGNWQHKWFGFWRTVPAGQEACPEQQQAVDTEWQPDDKAQLIEYLKTAPKVLPLHKAEPTLRAICPQCGDDLGADMYVLSDDVWTWMSDLAHDVAVHAIRLPDSFVEHIRQRNYTPPTEQVLPLEKLPYPPPPTVAPESTAEPTVDKRTWTVSVSGAVDRLATAKVLRATCKLSLAEAKNRVDQLPGIVFTGAAPEAQKLSAGLTAEGIHHECLPQD